MDAVNEREVSPAIEIASRTIAIAVVEHAGQFLIGQRPAGAPLAGYWEFPGGKVARGESPRAAAARECLEETGLAVDVGDAYPIVEHAYDYGKLALHFFACRPRDPAQTPMAPFRWTPAAELASYRFPEANAALIEQLLRSVGRHE